MLMFLLARTTELSQACASLTEWLLNPHPDGEYRHPFNYALKTQESWYAWMEHPENAVRHKQVGRAMTVTNALEGGNIADMSCT